MRRLRSFWPPALVLVALIGVWEAYVDLGGADRLILPPPHAVARSLIDDRGLLWSNFLVTAEEVLFGIAAAAVAGLGLAIAIHLSATMRRAVYPLLVASQTVPIPMVAPLLILWLGFGILPKVIVVALVSFFVIVVTTLAGLAAVDPAIAKVMRTLGAGRVEMLRHVELPAALPGLFTGVRVAVVFAVIGAVFAEQSGSSSGLGYVFDISQGQLLMARAWASVALLSLFAIVLFAGMAILERLALPWAHSASETIR